MNMRVLLCVGVAAVALTACGSDTGVGSEPTSGAPDPAAGACLVGDPNCQDTGPDAGGAFPTEMVRDSAEDLLGMPEDQLPDTVRVSRRGEEQLVLTEDYVEGRMTVELDPDDSGGFVVTSVTVEMPGGPETFGG